LSGYGEVRDGASKTYALMLKCRIVGENPCDVDKVFRKLKQFGHHARQGGGVCAVEMALMDLAGKAYGVPAYMLCGGKFRDHIRIYCDTPNEPSGEAMGYKLKERMARGFTMLKMDAGIQPLIGVKGALSYPAGMLNANDGTPLERLLDISRIPHPFTHVRLTPKGIRLLCEYIEQVRAIVGDEVPIAADHFGHIGLDDCIRLGEALEPYNLAWLEDLVPWQYTEQWVQLERSLKTPVCTGEDIYLKEGFMPLLQARAVNIIHPDLATSGGIAVGVVLGGFAWDHFGRGAFTLLVALYLVVVLCMLLAPKIIQVIEQGNIRAMGVRYWRIIRAPRLFIFIPAWICISALASIWLSSQITFILSKPHNDPHQLLMGSMAGPGSGHRLSLILGGYVLFFGLCLLFWAFFLNRVPRLRLMLISIAGVYIACIALAGINHRGIGNDTLLFVWMPLLLVGVFAEGSFAPAALAYLADISEEAAKDRGLLMGLYSIFLGLGQLIGNGVGGVFARIWGFDGLIYLTALLAFIALIFLLMLFRREKTAFRVSESSG